MLYEVITGDAAGVMRAGDQRDAQRALRELRDALGRDILGQVVGRGEDGGLVGKALERRFLDHHEAPGLDLAVIGHAGGGSQDLFDLVV